MDSYLLSTWIFIIILAEIFTIVNIYINTQLLKDRNAHLERTSDYCVPYYLLYTHNLLLSKKFLLLTWHIWKQKISPYLSKLGKAFLKWRISNYPFDLYTKNAGALKSKQIINWAQHSRSHKILSTHSFVVCHQWGRAGHCTSSTPY